MNSSQEEQEGEETLFKWNTGDMSVFCVNGYAMGDFVNAKVLLVASISFPIRTSVLSFLMFSKSTCRRNDDKRLMKSISSLKAVTLRLNVMLFKKNTFLVALLRRFGKSIVQR